MTEEPEVRRVLIVDDDPMVGQIALAHVRSVGAEGKVTESPEEFFELHRDWQPHVVMVDLVLGDKDGLDVLRRLADERSTASVIIASGVGQRVLDAASRFADGNGLIIAGVLAKPYRRKDLAALVHARATHTEGSDGDQRSAVPWSREQFGEEIDAAIRDGHIAIALQPKISCENFAVVGYEVLARWHHNDIGQIFPATFVPFAEKTGRVAALTSHVLRAGLDWFARRGAKDTHLAVNISAAEIENESVVARLRDACSDAGVDPTNVILELTETSAMKDVLHSLEALTHLRLAGFQLSLDDFGMGYSSMAQLARLPFTELKVDRSFVSAIDSKPESRVLVKSIIELGHGLGLTVTGEGVEEPRELQMLRELGCDAAQGFLFARPMSPEALTHWEMPDLDSAAAGATGT